jgi:hypothetical protein
VRHREEREVDVERVRQAAGRLDRAPRAVALLAALLARARDALAELAPRSAR